MVEHYNLQVQTDDTNVYPFKNQVLEMSISIHDRATNKSIIGLTVPLGIRIHNKNTPKSNLPAIDYFKVHNKDALLINKFTGTSPPITIELLRCTGLRDVVIEFYPLEEYTNFPFKISSAFSIPMRVIETQLEITNKDQIKPIFYKDMGGMGNHMELEIAYKNCNGVVMGRPDGLALKLLLYYHEDGKKVEGSNVLSVKPGQNMNLGADGRATIHFRLNEGSNNRDADHENESKLCSTCKQDLKKKKTKQNDQSTKVVKKLSPKKWTSSSTGSPQTHDGKSFVVEVCPLNPRGDPALNNISPARSPPILVLSKITPKKPKTTTTPGVSSHFSANAAPPQPLDSSYPQQLATLTNYAENTAHVLRQLQPLALPHGYGKQVDDLLHGFASLKLESTSSSLIPTVTPANLDTPRPPRMPPPPPTGPSLSRVFDTMGSETAEGGHILRVNTAPPKLPRQQRLLVGPTPARSSTSNFVDNSALVEGIIYGTRDAYANIYSSPPKRSASSMSDNENLFGEKIIRRKVSDEIFDDDLSTWINAQQSLTQANEVSSSNVLNQGAREVSTSAEQHQVAEPNADFDPLFTEYDFACESSFGKFSESTS